METAPLKNSEAYPEWLPENTERLDESPASCHCVFVLKPIHFAHSAQPLDALAWRSSVRRCRRLVDAHVVHQHLLRKVRG